MLKGERESGWKMGERNGSSEIIGGESAVITTDESCVIAWLTCTEMRTADSAGSK